MTHVYRRVKPRREVVFSKHGNEVLFEQLYGVRETVAVIRIQKSGGKKLTFVMSPGMFIAKRSLILGYLEAVRADDFRKYQFTDYLRYNGISYLSLD